MKILIIGSGGREHALAWKIAQSPKVQKVYAAPGNGGIALEPKCHILPDWADAVSQKGQDRLIAFARSEKIALTIVGPEAPLAAGIVDRFRSEDLAILGPTQGAARLESSKQFAKSFMQTYGVRSAESRSFSDYPSACRYAEEYFRLKSPLVVKADGLAGGKGVVLHRNFPETEKTLQAFMQAGILGESGKTVVLEDFLPGSEVSILAGLSVFPGKPSSIALFVPARDYKRRFDGGLGPNTGGMGAVAPAPGFSASAQADFVQAILQPTLKGLEQEGLDYRGFIFFGLMIQEDRCYLLEYNARLGDPETQGVLPLADFDFIDVCTRILDGGLGDFRLSWKSGAVCAPVAVASGYPGEYRVGDRIAFKAGAENRHIFFAGAERTSDGLYTSGGRVFSAAAWGPDLETAREWAYRTFESVHFPGMEYRKDIGLP